MEKLITIDDMTQQVKTVLDGFVEDFDVEAIVEEIHRDHGLIDIDGLDDSEFWAIVERHDLVNVPPSRSKRQPPAYGE